MTDQQLISHTHWIASCIQSKSPALAELLVELQFRLKTMGLDAELDAITGEDD